MQTLSCSSLLALRSCCLQLSWHPFSLPEMTQTEQRGRDGGTSGLALARNEKKWWRQGREVSDTWRGKLSGILMPILVHFSCLWGKIHCKVNLQLFFFCLFWVMITLEDLLCRQLLQWSHVCFEYLASTKGFHNMKNWVLGFQRVQPFMHMSINSPFDLSLGF